MLNKGLSKQVSVRLFEVIRSMDVSSLTERNTGMKHFSMACAIGAVLCVSSTAFAQNNPPSSATGLQAGDNAQTTNQAAGMGTTGTTHHKSMKHKSSSSMGKSNTPGMGTATPSGPAAPVTASGSGS